jgi:hypothetical protein
MGHQLTVAVPSQTLKASLQMELPHAVQA